MENFRIIMDDDEVHTDNIIYGILVPPVTNSWMMNGVGINNTFDKNSIINKKSTTFQFYVGYKPWATAGNVHIQFRLSEGAALRV